MANPYTGLTASVRVGAHPSAEILAYMSGMSLDLEKDIIEILAFGMQYKEKVPAIKDWSASVDGTAAFVAGGTQEQLYLAYENGTPLVIGTYLSPTVYFEGTGFVSSLSIDTAPDDKVNISAEISGSGAVVFNLPGGDGMLTFSTADHATSGATKIDTVDPELTGGNAYMYKINASLPSIGSDLAGKGWATYTLGDAIMVVDGNIVTLAEVDGTEVVKRGQAVAVVTT